jgi:hypothetical protein
VAIGGFGREVSELQTTLATNSSMVHLYAHGSRDEIMTRSNDWQANEQ